MVDRGIKSMGCCCVRLYKWERNAVRGCAFLLFDFILFLLFFFLPAPPPLLIFYLTRLRVKNPPLIPVCVCLEAFWEIGVEDNQGA